MYNTKSKFHKGSSVLVSTLITAAASAMIGYGITKMIATGINSINNQQVKMQAQQYAASRINVLRSIRYDNLTGMTKRQIGTTDYYEEVTKTGDSDGSIGDAYQVAIYKGADSNNPVTTMNFYRSNPGILLDNQVESGSGNADSSALIQSALKDYTNSQFGEGSESESSNKAMGIKSFTSYVDGLLSKYRINAVAAWNIEGSNTFNQNGSDRRPIYIDKGSKYNYAAQGSVTYSMSGNSEGYLATVTPSANGLFYIDYTEKDENTETGSGTTKPGGSVGGSENQTVLTIPDNVGVFRITGRKEIENKTILNTACPFTIPSSSKLYNLIYKYKHFALPFDVNDWPSYYVYISAAKAPLNCIIYTLDGKKASFQTQLTCKGYGTNIDQAPVGCFFRFNTSGNLQLNYYTESIYSANNTLSAADRYYDCNVSATLTSLGFNSAEAEKLINYGGWVQFEKVGID